MLIVRSSIVHEFPAVYSGPNNSTLSGLAFFPGAFFRRLHIRLFEFKPFRFEGKYGRLSMIFSSPREGGGWVGVGKSGAGGSRTLVQTDSRDAFYTLIRLLVVGKGSGNGTQGLLLSSLSRRAAEATAQPARNCERPVVRLESGISAGRTSCPGTLSRD